MRRFRSKYCALVVAVSLVVAGAGCTHRVVQKIDPAAVKAGQDEIVGITTQRGDDVRFDPPGASLKDGSLYGKTHGSSYTIPVSEVQRFWVTRVEPAPARTVGLIAAVTAGALVATVAIIAVAKQSCPFVYSWDGAKYEFDAEPYGGAIAPGLERDDYSEMEHLRPDAAGSYRLLVTNEVDETQFTNAMELWVVDHEPGARIVVDERGRLHALRHLQAPASATDSEGRNLLPWLRATDRLVWESEPVPLPNGALRDEVVLTFAKPERAGQPTLVVNAATGLWGSYMIKKMVELRGRGAPAWLDSLRPGSAELQSLHSWIAREDIYRLNIEVEEGDGWHVRASVPPGGPLIAEDRAIPLDASRATGDRLRLRIRPPRGFWALNSFAIDYSGSPVPKMTVVSPTLARTGTGRDVLADLFRSDDRYYAMPTTEDRATVEFKAPPAAPGAERSVFLHTRGWYSLHLNVERDPDTTSLDAILGTRDGAARFAAREYARWKSEHSVLSSSLP